MKRLLCLVLTVATILITFNTYAVNILYAEDNKSHDLPLFTIKSFQIMGNTKLDQSAIDIALGKFTGEKKDFTTIQKAVDTLETMYRKRGYTTVQVILPEQELKEGIIRLVIIEKSIKSVKIEGNKYFDEQNIRKSVPALREGELPDFDKISTELKLANEHPAKKLSLMLKPGENESVIDADLKVIDEKAWRVSLTGDNTGNDNTGESRAGVLLQYNNLFNLDHLVTLQYVTSPEEVDNVTILGFGYRIPLYAFGDSVDLYATYSDIDSGTVQAGITDMQISGRGAFFGMKYNQNLTPIGNYNHELVYGLDYRKYRDNVSMASAQDMDTDITVHPVSLAYAGNYRFSRGVAGFNLSVAHNIPGGSNGDDEDFENVCYDASADYTVFQYGANVSYALPADIQLRLFYKGQYANDALIPGEQFGLGGASSVRGYHEREVSDDRGNIGTIELYSPDICRAMNINKAQCRMLVFYDVGDVSRVSPLPDEESYTSASSVGAGIRLQMGNYFSLATDYGYGTHVNGTRMDRHSRWHLMAILSF